MFHVSLLKPFHSGGDGQDAPAPILVDGEVEYEVDSIMGHQINRGLVNIWFLLLDITCLRHCGWVQANCLMLLTLWKNTILLIGWSDGFDLWNCVLLQRWVCVCTRLPIYGALEWIWWGFMPQCPGRIGFQYGGQLGKHMYLLAKGLVAFRFVYHLGTENYLPWPLSARCTWGWLLASVWLCCPWAFVLQVPFSILVWGSCKGLPITRACHVLVAQMTQAHRHTCSTYI